VKTTGIYCRPICPARTPLRKNVRFFVCAAAAEEAGFRPCRRCRPDTAPGTPAWIGPSAIVSRAVRLIERGVLDEASVDELAGRVGLGGRQLRRLFAEHLGTSPLLVARSRRAHFARLLLDATAWPMTQVAQEAGFRSLRRFNEVMLAVFHRTPSELRCREARTALPSRSGSRTGRRTTGPRWSPSWARAPFRGWRQSTPAGIAGPSRTAGSKYVRTAGTLWRSP